MNEKVIKPIFDKMISPNPVSKAFFLPNRDIVLALIKQLMNDAKLNAEITNDSSTGDIIFLPCLLKFSRTNSGKNKLIVTVYNPAMK